MSSRTSNTLRNITTSMIMGVMLLVVSFIAQKILIDTLGVQYAGINSLFTNIVSMLAIAELGLATAVVYHLYEPLHRGNLEKISSLMRFYRNGYRLIALLVFVLGSLLVPFLPLVVGDNQIDRNISIIYMLFVINASVSYILTYKRSILYADQKNYIVNSIHFFVLLILNVLQIWLLIATKNFYLYLILKIIATFAENFIINMIVNKSYDLNNNPEPITKDLKADIFTKINGLIFHKVGSFLVLGSTSIIISVFLGITAVGLYSNYLLIQAAIISLFTQVTAAIKASVGNLLVDVGDKKSIVVFKRLQFANQIMAVFSVSIFLVASESFITLWLGNEFVLSLGIVAALALNIYLMLIRSVFGNFKEARGIFYEDRYVPIAESAINIITSIILIQFMGLAGAFIGTALSSLTLHAYSFPKYVYKGIFGRTYSEYAKSVGSNFLIALVVVAFAYFVSEFIQFDSRLIQLLSDTGVAIIIPGVFLWLLHHKKDEYIYFKKLASRLTKLTKINNK